jgi:hypothetical protein
MALSMTITEDKAMNEIIRAVAITTEDQALVWITDALDKGNFSKEADCYRLAEKFELDLEPIQAAWNEKRQISFSSLSNVSRSSFESDKSEERLRYNTQGRLRLPRRSG